jgi:hypothetical protein
MNVFADMYVHPQEIDYNIDSLFELIDASGLEFIGFSNPNYWNLERLIGDSPELLERASQLSDRQRYRLIELLDPEMSHYEFFLGRSPLPRNNWSNDRALLAAIPERSPCMNGWPSQNLFDYNYQIVSLSDPEFEFLKTCDENAEYPRTVGEILTHSQLDLEEVRSLLNRQLILLSPSQN